jgi:hypothetical protein
MDEQLMMNEWKMDGWMDEGWIDDGWIKGASMIDERWMDGLKIDIN